jgi:hypothetical protein
MRRPTNQRVPHIVPRRDRREHQSFRSFRRKVLQAVHGEIDRPTEQPVFDLFDEDTLPERRGERDVRALVPFGLDDRDLDRKPGPRGTEALRDVVRLPQR